MAQTGSSERSIDLAYSEWAAIRRFASMAHPEESQDLACFFTDEYPLLVKQTALQGIHTIFYLAPKAESLELNNIAEAVYQIAKSISTFVDLDQTRSTDRLTLALNALGALACLRDSRLASVWHMFCESKSPWLARRARKTLADITSQWHSQYAQALLVLPGYVGNKASQAAT